jgi:hypothetical protein
VLQSNLEFAERLLRERLARRSPFDVFLTNVDVEFPYAEQVFDGPRVKAQPSAFLAYARGLRSWLLETFWSERGKDTADNPAEYRRLFSRG